MSYIDNIEQNKKWEVLSSNYLIKNKWLVVRQDCVKLPTGAEMDDYYVLEYPDWIIVIAITEDGKFIIERQYRHGVQETQYEICGGHVEKGEDAMEAAKRELLEETGYGEGNWSLFMVTNPNPAAMTTRSYTFVAEGVKKIASQNLEKTEDIDVFLINKEELLSLMKQGKISQGDMLAPLWKWMFENK